MFHVSKQLKLSLLFFQHCNKIFSTEIVNLVKYSKSIKVPARIKNHLTFVKLPGSRQSHPHTDVNTAPPKRHAWREKTHNKYGFTVCPFCRCEVQREQRDDQMSHRWHRRTRPQRHIQKYTLAHVRAAEACNGNVRDEVKTHHSMTKYTNTHTGTIMTTKDWNKYTGCRDLLALRSEGTTTRVSQTQGLTSQAHTVTHVSKHTWDNPLWRFEMSSSSIEAGW